MTWKHPLVECWKGQMFHMVSDYTLKKHSRLKQYLTEQAGEQSWTSIFTPNEKGLTHNISAIMLWRDEQMFSVMSLPSRNTLKEMNYLEIAKKIKSILSSVRFPSSRPWVKDVCARSSLKRRQVRKWGKQVKGQGRRQVRVWAQVKSHRGVLEWVTPHICPHPRRGK